MKSTPSVSRRLQRNQFLRFDHPRGLRLLAEQGALWVTVDGTPEDITLDAGACRIFDGDAAVLVGALHGDAVVSAAASRRTPRWHAWISHTAHRGAEAV